jgi:hypothetical protein
MTPTSAHAMPLGTATSVPPAVGIGKRIGTLGNLFRTLTPADGTKFMTPNNKARQPHLR